MQQLPSKVKKVPGRHCLFAFQHKTELELLQKQLNEAAEKAKKAGELPDPLTEWKKIEKEHQEYLATAKKALPKILRQRRLLQPKGFISLST
ncbi:MAG: hypothetical protein MZV64_48480 [Ignavibacteriales bacterium]|nr:hypothetical protein [Ignavibacteriales bacterium]